MIRSPRSAQRTCPGRRASCRGWTCARGPRSQLSDPATGEQHRARLPRLGQRAGGQQAAFTGEPSWTPRAALRPRLRAAVAAGPGPRRALRAARVARAPGRGDRAAGDAAVQRRRDDARRQARLRDRRHGAARAPRERAGRRRELPIEALDLALHNWGARALAIARPTARGRWPTTASATRSPPCSASELGAGAQTSVDF